jgi:hypothetical protein
MKFLSFSSFISFFLLIPKIVGATTKGILQLNTIIVSVDQIIRFLIPIAFGSAVVFFFWGLARYILSSGDERKVSEGKWIMIFGTIALFVASSIWGIVLFIRNTIGIENDSTLITPYVKRP